MLLFSIAVLSGTGLAAGALCRKIRFPALIGMILVGMLLGPCCLNALDLSLLQISADIRRAALIIILLRGGLKLNIQDMEKIGRPAVLMCFVPACAEILGTVLLAPTLLGLSLQESALLGAVIGAVSPAVIVPRMIRLMDEGWGRDKAVPQMILAGASVDDVFVILLFTAFTGLVQGQDWSMWEVAQLPVSIGLGVLIGPLVGLLLGLAFQKLSLSFPVQVILLLCAAFLLSSLETLLPIPFASLLAVMSAGIAIRTKYPSKATELSGSLDTLWVPAEVFLFVLVGASVRLEAVPAAGPATLLLLSAVLMFRMTGVFLCLIKTGLTMREKGFCIIAYTPKATVQAAIGGIPLAMGLPCGEIILTVSVISILLTAPLGAFGIDLSYRKCLKKAATP